MFIDFGKMLQNPLFVSRGLHVKENRTNCMNSLPASEIFVESIKPTRIRARGVSCMVGDL